MNEKPKDKIKYIKVHKDCGTPVTYIPWSEFNIIYECPKCRKEIDVEKDTKRILVKK